MTSIKYVSDKFPIKPEHIDITRPFMEAFGQCETEISAAWLIKFAQQRGRGWEPFSYDDINSFYQKKYPNHNFSFNRLIHSESIPVSVVMVFAGEYNVLRKDVGGGWIVEIDDGVYAFTPDFVNRCFKASPIDFTLENQSNDE